jgi:APA family basic amino acid/polyamine antiporter
MSAEAPRLERSLGLLETTVGGVGIILGAGIYALIGEAAGRAGNAVWASFLLAASMAALTGLSYAEMASTYPKAGADYEYTRQAFGNWPAVLVGFTITAGNVIAAAAVSLGFGGYLRSLFDVDLTIGAVAALMGGAAIAAYGIRASLWVSIGLTIVEVSGLFLVMAVGLPHFGDRDLMEAADGLPGVFSAAALVMFAFIGFEQVATLSEETRDARRVVPRALLASIAVTTTIYLLVAVSAVSVLGSNALGESTSPLADVVSRVLGDRTSDVVALIALFSTFNTVLLMLVAASRLLYGMSERGSLPEAVGRVHPRFKTPFLAIALALAIAVLLALFGDISLVAESANFVIFLGFAAVNLSLIALRHRQPEIERPFRVPFSVGKTPILPLAALASIAFMIAHLQLDAIGLGLVLLLAGAIASSFAWVTRKRD